MSSEQVANFFDRAIELALESPKIIFLGVCAIFMGGVWSYLYITYYKTGSKYNDMVDKIRIGLGLLWISPFFTVSFFFIVGGDSKFLYADIMNAIFPAVIIAGIAQAIAFALTVMMMRAEE